MNIPLWVAVASALVIIILLWLLYEGNIDPIKRAKLVKFKNGDYGIRSRVWFTYKYYMENRAGVTRWVRIHNSTFYRCKISKEKALSIMDIWTDKGDTNV